MRKLTVASELIRLGLPIVCDTGVILGYKPGRSVADLALTIGEGAHLRSGSIIYAGSRIGKGLETGHNVVIREESKIGDDFAIWNNSVVDYGCRIGNGVKVHCNCYIAQFTVIEDGAFLAPGVTIANDIHPGCKFSRECMRGPTIGRAAQIGVNVTILPFLNIGERALIGAGSVVTKDIPAGAVAYGNPARVKGKVTDLVCVTGLTDRPYPES